jgi:hypothetical protein
MENDCKGQMERRDRTRRALPLGFLLSVSPQVPDQRPIVGRGHDAPVFFGVDIRPHPVFKDDDRFAVGFGVWQPLHDQVPGDDNDSASVAHDSASSQKPYAFPRGCGGFDLNPKTVLTLLDLYFGKLANHHITGFAVIKILHQIDEKGLTPGFDDAAVFTVFRYPCHRQESIVTTDRTDLHRFHAIRAVHDFFPFY